jgi:hypothetical protein
MKYFTLELLDKLSNRSDPEYEIYRKRWMENLTEYWSQFKSYENRLPTRFVKEYSKHAFHDYNIESINFYKEATKRRHCSNVEIDVSCDNDKFIIRYIGVTKYNTSVNIINPMRDNVFLYSEIHPVDNKKMSHEIHFLDRNIVYIEFEKIVFKKVTR